MTFVEVMILLPSQRFHRHFPFSRMVCFSCAPLRSVFAIQRRARLGKCTSSWTTVTFRQCTEISTPTPSLWFTSPSGLSSLRTTYNVRCRTPAKPIALRRAPGKHREYHRPRGSISQSRFNTLPLAVADRAAPSFAGQQTGSAAGVPAGGRV